tara:strand:- start:1314 stop:2354 length:1041 start_codon:yes stop_codon:yes gene_type:complete
MKIIDKSIKNIHDDPDLNVHFNSAKNNNLDINCNFLNDNFYIDAHNFFPISEDYFSFLELFSWGDKSKYNIFYTDSFINNFEANLNEFSHLSEIVVLGSSSNDNYYRNLITFFPRLFFLKNKKIKLALHRKSSNKYRNFIKKICNNLKIDTQFVFLDDGFYKFNKSQIPQFLNKRDSVQILNNLKLTNKSPKDRIYVTRQNTNYRNLINESDLIIQLKKLDFKVVDLNHYDIFEQIRIFSNAKIIVSPTGSALTNIVFCNPNTKIMEISPHYNYEYEETFKLKYKSISDMLNLEYMNIEADSVSVKNINENIQNKISKKILNESNYYKDLIIKLDKISIIENFSNL